MKKYITQYKWKKYLKKRIRNSAKKRLTRKNRIKLRKNETLKERIEFKKRERERFFSSFERKKAPDNFDLINNTEELLGYFNEVGELLESKKKVFFNLESISSLSSDALVLYAAYFNEAKLNYNTNLLGNHPKSNILKEKFYKSGFYSFVRSFNENKDLGNTFHRQTLTKVSTSIAKKATLQGMEKLDPKFRNPELIEDIYNTLIEAMSNTFSHANLDKNEKLKWWLLSYYNEESETISYTFLDLGVGIFNSLPVANYFRLKRYLGISENKDIIPDLLSGKIGSRMIIDNEIRGRGLLQMNSIAKNKEFLKFYIISNDIKINLKNEEYSSLKNNLSGTLIYWEIKNGNKR